MEEIKFVDVGEGITEGHVRKWLVKDGDQVREDQPVVQIETDKAVVNVPSPIQGTIKENVREGTDVHIGDVVAYIGRPEEIQAIRGQTPQFGAQQAEEQAAPQTAAQQPTMAAKERLREVIATPETRKLARDMGVNITQLTGTGPAGRILDSDVRNAAQKAQPRAVPKFSELLEEQHKGEVERVQMSQTRKAIARNMELSWTIPRAVHMDLLNATHLYDVVKQEKPNFEKLDVKLTFFPFIIKGTVEALKENPMFNSSYDHDTQEVIVKKYYNIGLAAEAPDGLKVVVVKNADKKSILDLAKEIQSLHKKVQEQTITLDEMKDSTFTITNIGSLGGGFLSVPMINYPEVAILGIHLIRDWPVVENGLIKVGKVLPISISFDHRVVDGSDAVKFSNSLIKYLEDPEFLEMLG